MLQQKFHEYRYTKLLGRVRRRSAIMLFFAFAAFFAMNPPVNNEICNNGVDDNLDGLVDCNDPECLGHTEFCAEAGTK